MIRVTIACPEALIGDANQLALCLGYGEADAQTYGAPAWQDSVGNFYAVASALVSETFAATAGSALVRPAWGANMAAATRAQGAIQIGGAADPAHLVAVFGDDPQAALEVLGVTAVPEAIIVESGQ